MSFFRRFFSQPFGSILAQVLIAILLLSGVLIAQHWSLKLYQVGLVALIVAAILQLGAGNIPPDANFRRTAALLGISLTIVAVVFASGILLVPFLVSLGER